MAFFNSITLYYKHTIKNRQVILKYDNNIRKLTIDIIRYKNSKRPSNSLIEYEKIFGLFLLTWITLPNDQYIINLSSKIELKGYPKLRMNWINKTPNYSIILLYINRRIFTNKLS